MSARIETYVHQSLSMAGFAILDPVMAATLRPDLWGGNGGMEASWEFDRAKNFLNGLKGVERFTLRLEGQRNMVLVARSPSHLAMRISWITGQEVEDLFHHSEVAPKPVSELVPPRVVKINLDKFDGIPSAVPGKTCSECDNLTAGHTCRATKQTGIHNPHANDVHRCLAFVPHYDAMDRRTGVQLWPELFAINK